MGSAAMLAAIVSSTGCKSSSSEGKGSTEFTQTATGAAEKTTYTTTATVTAIDPASRQVTLLNKDDGKSKTFTLGPAVRNFDQIHVGDLVRATVTEETALFLNKPGASPGASQTTTVTRAPQGGTPGMAMTDVAQVTGQIVAIDGRHVTLQFPDGQTKKVKVDKSVDTSGLKPGDLVTGQVTQAMAIKVEKPYVLTDSIAEMRTVPQRTSVGHGPGGLQSERRRLELKATSEVFPVGKTYL